MSVRQQGSAAWVIVVSGLTFLIFGAIISTFVLFPIHNGFTESAFWTATTTDGRRLLTYVGGLWQFAPAIILIALLAWVWVHSRQ